MELTTRIRTLIEAELIDSEYFIVDVIRGEKSRKIIVLLDGDNGVSIQKCAQVSRSVSKTIDEDSFESEPFVLEIGSPGASNPLTNPRQYAKHVGRTLVVTMKDETEYKGQLASTTEEGIELVSTGKKKKKKPVSTDTINKKSGPLDVEESTFLRFDHIQQSTVVISFK